MADINHVISLGIGSPADIRRFILFGLNPTVKSDTQIAYLDAYTISGCWGRATGVEEATSMPFTLLWTGTGTISGSGDAEKIELDPGEAMETGVINTKGKYVTLSKNKYDAGDNVLVHYKTGLSPLTCLASNWNAYSAPFLGKNYLKLKVSTLDAWESSSSLVLWLRADEGLYQDSGKTTPVTADGQSVGAWVDKSSNAYTFSQATGSKKPTYKTGIINGHPVVRADGGDVLTTTALSASSGPKTVFAVLKRTAGAFFFDSQTGRLVLSVTGSNTHYAWYDTAGWKNSALSPVSEFGVFTFWLGDPVQSQGEVFYNGASVGTGKFSNTGLGGTTALFGSYTNAGDITGDLAELIVFDGYLSSDLRKQVEAYLFNRYGISQINPYTSANTAYVTTGGNDGTGVLGNASLPFATINAAFGVIPAWGGIINIGAGTFAAINDDDPTIGAVIKRNTRLMGAGRPEFSGDKTSLTGGTIIKGPLWIKQDGVQLYNLGVDSGSAVCTADYGGVAQEGIRYDLWGSGGDQLQVKDVVLQNVASLCKSADALMHAMGFEGTYNVQASGLRTCYGVHGIALKSILASMSDIVCLGHNQNGIVIKIETSKVCNSIDISDVTIDHVISGDTNGIKFHWYNGTQDMHTIAVENIFVTTSAPTFGVDFSAGSGAYYIRDVVVNNLTGKTTVTKTGSSILRCVVNGVTV